MKKILLYNLLLIITFISCDPQEDRFLIGEPITSAQLDISATPVIVDGKKSNKVILENRSPVLSLWDYGIGSSNRSYEEILLVITGENKINFTGLNPDGSKITKELSVTVDELSFEVPAEWTLLCGDGNKVWIWDDTQPDEGIWGNGGYKIHSAPTWWIVNIDDIEEQVAGESRGAEMQFSLNGSKFSKTTSDGTVTEGTFSFDMSKVTLDDNGAVWAKGKLYTRNVTILCGISPNEEKAPVYELDIISLTENQMILAYAPAGSQTWDAAFYWVFRKK